MAQRSNGSRRARARASGGGCHAVASPPTRSGFSFMHSPENLGNFLRTLALPETAEPWLLTSLREKLIKIGAKLVSHGRYVVF